MYNSYRISRNLTKIIFIKVLLNIILLIVFTRQNILIYSLARK